MSGIDKQVYRVFYSLDKDNSGYIEREEIRKLA